MFSPIHFACTEAAVQALGIGGSVLDNINVSVGKGISIFY
jgi:hypothetical protein